MGTPSSSSSPVLAGISPPIIFRTVVFPQPLGPSNEMRSPRRNWNETSFTAGTGCPAVSNVLVTLTRRPKGGCWVPFGFSVPLRFTIVTYPSRHNRFRRQEAGGVDVFRLRGLFFRESAVLRHPVNGRFHPCCGKRAETILLNFRRDR